MIASGQQRMGADDDVDVAVASPSFTASISLRGTRREACAMRSGRPLKRSVKVAKCWRASSVVGTTTATCLPFMAATKAVRSATSVLPKPTSPQTSRSIGRPFCRSSSTASMAVKLVFGLLIGEAGAEFVEGAIGRRQNVAGLQFARRRRLDQVLGDLADAFLEAWPSWPARRRRRACRAARPVSSEP